MKNLMLTTAIVLTTAGGVMAQTTAPATTTAETTATTPGATNVPGFRASDFDGMNLYTLNPEVVTELRAQQSPNPSWDERTARWTSGETFIASRDQWEDIGAINDIVMSQDGEVRGILLDIGGFLGIGARTVMVDMDSLYFVADSTTPEDLGDFFVVASMSREQLEALPEWDEESLRIGYAWEGASADPAMGSTAPMAAAPDMATDAPAATAPMTDGMAMAPTAEELTGADVHDMAGESIGTVSDLMLEGDAVTGALIDVGGFLGIGSHSVVVPVDALVIVRDADNSVERVETSLTRAQLEAMPKHEG